MNRPERLHIFAKLSIRFLLLVFIFLIFTYLIYLLPQRHNGNPGQYYSILKLSEDEQKSSKDRFTSLVKTMSRQKVRTAAIKKDSVHDDPEVRTVVVDFLRAGLHWPRNSKILFADGSWISALNYLTDYFSHVKLSESREPIHVTLAGHGSPNSFYVFNNPDGHPTDNSRVVALASRPVLSPMVFNDRLVGGFLEERGLAADVRDERTALIGVLLLLREHLRQGDTLELLACEIAGGAAESPPGGTRDPEEGLLLRSLAVFLGKPRVLGYTSKIAWHNGRVVRIRSATALPASGVEVEFPPFPFVEVPRYSVASDG